jgi:DNA-binding transcriptional ArsR family regulator
MGSRKQKIDLDKVFSSLGDSTRRGILEKVKDKPLSVLELASDFNMSLPAVSKHIKVLSEAGLLKREKTGRFIYCSINPESLKPAVDWISDQYDVWDKSFAKLGEFMKNLESNKKNRK